MWARKNIRDSARLREAYIDISNYVRGLPIRAPTSCSSCLKPSNIPSRSLHSSALRYKVHLDPTRHFPTPPESGFAPTFVDPDAVNRDQRQEGGEVAEKEQQHDPGQLALHDQLDQLISGGENDAGPLDPRIPQGMPTYLQDYKRRHHLVGDAYPWDFLEFFRRPPTLEDPAVPVKLYGYITADRGTRAAAFYSLVDPQLRRQVQLVASVLPKDSTRSSAEEQAESRGNDASRRKIKRHTPVLVSGRIIRRPDYKSSSESAPELSQPPKIRRGAKGSPNTPPRRTQKTTRTQIDPSIGKVEQIAHLEIHADTILVLNDMPLNALPTWDHVPGPDQRHLQIRVDQELRQALRLRSKAMAESRKFLFMKKFDEIETPLLFKSTSEGAREFIVPTRTKGTAYALPQSPQQYKQILMASGIGRYFQFAKCFRDEDMRADRQPEFTQLDLEMAFARREDVMLIIERLIAQTIWPGITDSYPFEGSLKSDPPLSAPYTPSTKLMFPRYTYHKAMSMYGSDKPDPRLESQIHRVENLVPPNLKNMLTSLDDPIIEIIKIDMNGSTIANSSQFISEFLDSKSSSVYVNNPAGAPGVTVYDPRKPLNGLASFGHEAAEKVEELLDPVVGDIIIVQARANAPFAGGSTILGNLRREIHQAAVAKQIRNPPKHDSFVWVTDFPLFSPIDEKELSPGQSGGAGICSTHHPFTAPKLNQDLTKLWTDPLSVIGDHYDLVINGVEVGGGSRRIHEAKMQEIIFRDILKMPAAKIDEFSHLLKVLASGCPPHAGFALGFDRLMALALKRPSVRDVIAFPKFGYGEGSGDHLVGSPGVLTKSALETYHLAVKETGTPTLEEKVSNKA